MKLLVLYEELAPYFLSNIEKFADTYRVPVMIVCKPTNPIAPFQFQIQSNYIEIVERTHLSFEKLLEKIKTFQPTALMQAGWIYEPYFEITRYLHLTNNILLLDNQWRNTIRQNIGSVYFKWKYKKLFHKAFVPGNKQKEFAKHLGFKDTEIILGFYCCDTEKFENIYLKRKQNPKRNYTFLYIGRYAPEKNIETLWKVFAEICTKYPNTWKLICAGKGNIPIQNHPQIQHIGFIQPHQLPDVLINADVFVLPSTFEPWGVVIHEMTTAGLPIISSSAVGANEFFVRHNENGYIFDVRHPAQLKKYLLQMMNLSDEEYLKMSEKSYELSQQINTHKWIKKIYDICQI